MKEKQKPENLNLLQSSETVDHFKIIRLIGKGGMGEVYLARDTKLGRKVALKIIKSEFVKDEDELNRFMFEAKITASFNHPHIITIYEVGRYGNYPYIALEYLEGETLKERLNQSIPGIWEIIRFSLSIADALKQAHAKKLLHRDLKPENIFIPRDGRLRVLDFGLARFSYSKRKAVKKVSNIQDIVLPDDNETVKFGKTAPDAENTQNYLTDADFSDQSSSQLKGTPPYMAPELWKEEPPDEYSDIFSFGVLMYEAVTGEQPFKGKTIYNLALDIISGKKPESPSAFRQLPRKFENLIMSCLEKERTLRPDINEVYSVLNRIVLTKRGFSEKETKPFKGLNPFREQDAAFFFGRENEINSFIEKIREEPVLPVVGPSGAGKSSFVQAGIIPRLKEDGEWIVISMKPGFSPFKTLTSKLNNLFENKDSGFEKITPELLKNNAGKLELALEKLGKLYKSKVLLFIDQLEEVHTHVQDFETRNAFMNAICTAADDKDLNIRVIFTLRDDFLGQAAENKLTQKILQKVTVIRNPGSVSLKEIIEKPLELLGYAFDDENLIEEMLESVAGEVSSLPLLQFVLSELWEERDKNRKIIKRSVYDKIGGIEGALAHHADKTLDGLSPAGVELARKLLIRLVNEDKTRRVMTGKHLLQGFSSEASDILNVLIGARLVSVRKSGSDHYENSEFEIVHESLIVKWKKFNDWIDENKIEIAFINELNQATSLWIKRGKRKEEVWSGQALYDALAVIKKYDIPLTDEVKEFLNSAQHREREIKRKKLIFKFSGVGILVLIAVVSVIVAVQFSNRKREAENAEKIALKQKKLALKKWSQALSEGAKADFANGHIFEAKAKLRGSLELSDSSSARILWHKISDSRLIWKKNVGATIYDAAFSHDGKYLALACINKNIYLFDVKTRKVNIFRGSREQLLSIAWSKDDKTLISGSYNGDIGFWNVRNGSVKFVKGHKSRIKSIDTSPVADTAATAGLDGIVRIWNLKDYSLLKTLKYKNENWWAVKFSYDGKFISAGSGKGNIVTWSIKSGRIYKVIHAHKGRITFLSRNKNKLVSGGVDKTVKLWNLNSDKNEFTFKPQYIVKAFDISRDGKLGILEQNKKILILDFKTKRVLQKFDAFTERIRSIKFAPSGKFFVSASSDNTVKLWKNVIKNRILLGGHKSKIVGVAWSPDDKYIASGGGDKNIRIWNAATGRQIAVLKGHKGVIMGVAWSPDGRFVASASVDKTIIIRNARTFEINKILKRHGGIVTQLDFSPDSNFLASGSFDGTVRIWNVQTGKQIKVFKEHSSHIWTTAFDPSGDFLASGSNDKTIIVRNLRDNTEFVLKGHPDSVNGIAFSPDGNFIVSGDDSKNLMLWDLKTKTGKKLGKAPGRIYWLDFNKDGETVGISGSSGIFGTWNIKTGKRHFFKGYIKEVNSIKFSHNGKLFVTGADNGILKVWNTGNLRPVWILKAVIPEPFAILTHEGLLNLYGKPLKSGFKNKKWYKALKKEYGVFDPSGQLLAITDSKHSKTELWDTSEDKVIKTFDKNVFFTSVPGGLVKTENLKNTLYINKLRKINLSGGNKVFPGNGKFLIINKNEISVFTNEGKPVKRIKNSNNVTSAFAGKNYILLGLENGNIKVIPLNSGQKSFFIFESTPPNSVTYIIGGPDNTVMAGYDNGFTGIWNLTNKNLLISDYLHGKIRFLRYKNGLLTIVTEPGGIYTKNLTVFEKEYCELMKIIWSEIPVIWKSGLVIPSPPPEKHICFN